MHYYSHEKDLFSYSRHNKFHFLVITQSFISSLDASVWSWCVPAGEMPDQSPVRKKKQKTCAQTVY